MSNFMSYENAQSVLGEFAEAIKSGGGGGSSEPSSLLIVTFDSDFIGESYTIKQGNTTIKTGTVPQSCEVRFTVQGANETYHVYSSIDSKEYSNSVNTVEYYGEYTVHLYKYHIYGARWDSDPSPVWERTDDAAEFTDPVPYVEGAENYGSPFDNIYPWSGMIRVQYDNNPDFEMVKLPRFWYKLEEYGDGGLSIKIADAPVEGYTVCPACRKHWTDNDTDTERSYILVARYATSYESVNEGYRSKSGTTTGSNMQYMRKLNDAYYDIIHLDRGNDFWTFDFDAWFTTYMLYLVEFASWDLKSCIGNFYNSDTKTGNTDSMPYHTGTMSSSKSTAGSWQYRNIENLICSRNSQWLPGISAQNINNNAHYFVYDRLISRHSDSIYKSRDPWVKEIQTDLNVSIASNSIAASKKFKVISHEGYSFPVAIESNSTNYGTTYACSRAFVIGRYMIDANISAIYNGMGGSVIPESSDSVEPATASGYPEDRIMIIPEEARVYD